jgi:hypothetical protein
MHALKPSDFADLYAKFNVPVTTFDCGAKCAPHNEYGIPFCCDTNHAIPSAYLPEWRFLKANTDLWHPWLDKDADETKRLRNQLPKGQILIECLGHTLCQRSFRSVTCRAFPFFPFISKSNEFLGLSYYWEYEDRCWVISHLDTVTPTYRDAFVNACENIFEYFPEEFSNFRYHSIIMRRVFGRQKRMIPLLHRDGSMYLITPKNGQIDRVGWADLPKFGPYEIADMLPFPEEK